MPSSECRGAATGSTTCSGLQSAARVCAWCWWLSSFHGSGPQEYAPRLGRHECSPLLARFLLPPWLNLQENGNIVIMSESQGEIWNSNSAEQCTEKCFLILKDDGTLLLEMKVGAGQYLDAWVLTDRVWCEDCACACAPARFNRALARCENCCRRPLRTATQGCGFFPRSPLSSDARSCCCLWRRWAASRHGFPLWPSAI